MYEREEKISAFGHICDSVHENAAIVNSPVTVNRPDHPFLEEFEKWRKNEPPHDSL